MTKMSRPEFIALIAMMFATIAISIDAMLPALPEIGAELSPGNVNRAQLVLTAFVVGLGAGTFVVGPLSDRFGRKPVILAGAAVYISGAIAAWASQSLEVLLLSRILQGLGASAPRIVSIAIMRDLFSGRIMARMMSLAMMIFTVFPAFAPLIGQGIIALSDWRGIFLAFVLFSAVSMLWLVVRLPETLPRGARRPFRLPHMMEAVREMTTHPTVRLSIMVQTLCLGLLFTMLVMVQPVYDVVYGRSEQFPTLFAIIALIAGSASLLNAALVVRLGMRRMVIWSLATQMILSATILGLSYAPLPDLLSFVLFLVWQCSVFFIAGTTLGNLNAIAMEPMGHIAGMAASVIGAISTVLAAGIASAVGQLFDGTVVPLAAALSVMSGTGFLLMRRMEQIEDRLPV